MEELQDARAQLTAAKAALSESEREMEAREEQLVVATDNLAAVQQDRTRLQQDLVALGAQLGEAETRRLGEPLIDVGVYVRSTFTFGVGNFSVDISFRVVH